MLCETGADFGFHILPSSRLPLVGLLISVWLLFLFKNKKNINFILIPFIFVLQYIAFLKFLTQGRYFITLSVASIVPIILFMKEFHLRIRNSIKSLLIVVFLLVAISNDLVVGTGINVGWNCNRVLIFSKAHDTTYDIKTEVDLFLKNKMAKNNVMCKQKGSSPSFLAEHAIDYKPYLGFHYVYADMSTNLLYKFKQVNPEVNFSESIAGFIYQDDNFPKLFLSKNELKDYFEPCYMENFTKILCNKKIVDDFCFKPIYKEYLLY